MVVLSVFFSSFFRIVLPGGLALQPCPRDLQLRTVVQARRVGRGQVGVASVLGPFVWPRQPPADASTAAKVEKASEEIIYSVRWIILGPTFSANVCNMLCLSLPLRFSGVVVQTWRIGRGQVGVTPFVWPRQLPADAGTTAKVEKVPEEIAFIYVNPIEAGMFLLLFAMI